MNAKSEKLTERSILQLKARIPEYVDQTIKQAYAKALTSGSTVLEAVNSKLVESDAEEGEAKP